MASGGRVGDSRSATLCSTPLRCTSVARERQGEGEVHREGGREREFVGRRGYKAHAMPAEHERRGILAGVGVSRGSRSVEKGEREAGRVAQRWRRRRDARRERVSHQPTSTRRVTSLVDPETSRCFFSLGTGNWGLLLREELPP